jgi:hypothetical protein
LLIAIPAFAQTSNISLRFDPTTPMAGTSISFNAVDSGVLSGNAVADIPVEAPVTTQEEKYVLMVDSQSYHRDKFHRFSFDCYVKAAASAAAAPVHKFTVWESPIGKFPDMIGPATAHVTGANGTDVAVMQLPQHSEDSTNVIVAVPASPFPVPMGHSSRMELGLNNNLSSLHANIDAINVVATKCPECWAGFTGKALHNKLGIGQATSLMIDLQPNSGAALKRNLVVFDSGSSQEDLVVTVTSEADEGGAELSQDFRVPVRFTPDGRLLVFSMICGALIGCLIRYLISRQTPPRLTLLEAGIVTATAAVAWLLMFGLFATKTKLTILGYDLDPTQMIPAGLITLLAAGGASFAHRLAELFGSK